MSKLGKTKTIQKGEIKPQNFTTQHKIAYEADELVTGLQGVKPIILIKSEKDEKTSTPKGIEQTEKDINSVPQGLEEKKTSPSYKELENKNNCPVKIEDAIVWGLDTPKPQCIEDILRQIKGLFNIGKEVSGWSISYYPPPELGINGKYLNEKLTIKPAPSSIAARYILCLGSMEVLNMSADAGGKSGEGKIFIGKSTVMNFPIGICTASDIIFSNQTAGFLEGQKGFRQRRVNKDPSKRHILVFDGHFNISSLTNAIKNNSKTITKNSDDADKLSNKMNEMFQISDVDALAKHISASEIAVS